MRKDRFAGQWGFCAAAALFCLVSPIVSAEYIQAALPEYNWSLNEMTNGAAYGTGGDYLSLNGDVPFTIANGVNGAPNIWHSYHSSSHVLTIPVDTYGVTAVHTFINTWWGQSGANIATISFAGSDGAAYSVDLIMGTNVRDHYQGFYVNHIVGDMTYLAYNPGSGVILDRQQIVLPEAFQTQTLTRITVTDTNLGSHTRGKIFLTAVTLQRIPEPATVLLLTAGVLGFLPKRRQRH